MLNIDSFTKTMNHVEEKKEIYQENYDRLESTESESEESESEEYELGYLETPFADCQIKSAQEKDSHIFHASKMDLVRNSNVFRAMFEDDKNPVIELDYTNKTINTWLRTFCLDESNRPYEIKDIQMSDLPQLIPLYNKYDMPRQLNKCRRLIEECSSMSEELVKIIMETPGFENEREKTLYLMIDEKIPAYLEYISKDILFNKLLISKKKESKYKKVLNKLYDISLHAADRFVGANRFNHYSELHRVISIHRENYKNYF